MNWEELPFLGSEKKSENQLLQKVYRTVQVSESYFLCLTVSSRSVPVGMWSGQVECLWELEVVESWRFVTATELAFEPKPAGESSAVAHSHCEPRPFLYVPNIQGVKILKGHYLPVPMSHQKKKDVCTHVCINSEPYLVLSHSATCQTKMSHKHVSRVWLIYVTILKHLFC